MGSIVQKVAADRVLILDPREFHTRQFDFDNWTEMRMGFFFSGVAAIGDNTASASEEVTQITVDDLITVGLKNSDTDDLPGQAGSLFIGAKSYSSKANCNGAAFFSNAGSNKLTAAAYNGASLIGGAGSDLNGLDYASNVTGITTYNGFWVLKLVITNRGLATQSIALSTGQTSNVSGADYSPSALRTLMNSATFTVPVTLAWNDGVAARPIPDSYWIRLPFYSNRIRLSCIRATRYTP